MPFVANMNDTAEDPDQKKTSQAMQPGAQSPTSGGAVHLAPASSVPAGSTGTSGGPSSPANAGGQFASLNQYLTANADKAQPLANKLTSDIGKQYQGLEQGNQQTLASINNQVSANSVDQNAGKTLAEESANPVSFAGDPNKAASFQKLLNASYAGPQSAEGTSDFANQQTAINKAISEGQNTVKSEAGRKNLLMGSEANPTSGVTALNSAILSKSPEALASVEGAYKPFQNLVTGLQSGATETNKAIAAQQTQTAEANKTANKQVADQTAALNAGVGKRLEDAQNQVKQYNTNWQGLQDKLTPFNTALNAYTNSSGFTVANPFTQYGNVPQIINAPTLGQVATPEDFATFQALMGLTQGQAASPLAGVSPDQAGTFQAPAAAPNIDYKTLAQQTADDMIQKEQGHTWTNTDLDRWQRDKGDEQNLANLLRGWGATINPAYVPLQ